MRFAFISANKGLPWGGSEELWAAAAKTALREKHEVIVCVFAWPEPAAKVQELQQAGAELIRIPLKARRLPLWGYGWMRKLIARAPDVVCISQGQEYDLAGRSWGADLIEWLSRSQTPCASVVQYNDDVARPSARGERNAKAIIELAQFNGYVAARNIAQTERVLEMKVPRATVVRNPVNLNDTSRLEWPTSAGVRRFASVARLHAATKGQDALLSVLSEPAWKDRAWELSLFGVGPDEANFRKLAQLGGIAERVHFCGRTSDIRKVWREHHALIMPSRGEGTPLAMVEAMLSGRPCLVTDVGDCAAWVREGIEGWIAARPESAEVRAALERMWNARDSWQLMGDAAADRAWELFDPDAGGTLLTVLKACVSDHAKLAPHQRK
ncbi:MAG: glycosyltransferase family 4 protein [Planctomycetes bacterium]|nr:glycosyltransferase family 4 protein [Planctomycetota bacterium]